MRMPDCGVCIGGGDYDGTPEFQTICDVTARKVHRCCECRRQIMPGQVYRRCSWKFDGNFGFSKTCHVCVEIHDTFNCDGGALEDNLWDDIRQYVFPQFSMACLDRLQTVEAKRYLQERWMKWKGLS
jgi:hypothetical protein